MRKRKAVMLLSVMLLLSSVLTGCGATGYSEKTAAESPGAAPEMNYATDDIYLNTESAVTEEVVEEDFGSISGEGQTGVPETTNRKLIKTVDMNVETEEYDVLFPKVEKRITELGGYIENLSEQQDGYGYERNLRYVSITARIPADRLDNFLTEVEAASNVLSRNERVEDVTLSYVDLESRKKALTTERDRLLELLEQAETVEDIITIEGRISQVSYEIESMESQLRTYDNQINYSTVYLYISEVERLTPPVEETALERIKTGLSENTYSVITGLQNFGIGLIIGLPYLVVWAVVILILFVIVRIVIKSQKKKKAKKELQKQMLTAAPQPCATQNGVQTNMPQNQTEQKKE